MQASSAAPPGGGAPAASREPDSHGRKATGPASRAERGELEDWAQETIADLNQFMVEMFKPHINPSKKLVLQMVTQAREHSPEVVCQAIWWCFYGHSEHRMVTDLNNPAGFLTDCLPGVVSDYTVARERQARELRVEDSAGFDLYTWCEEQAEVERAARAEREAQEVEEEQDRAESEAAKQQADEKRSVRLQEAYAKERDHRDEHPEHYGPCGKCRRCQVGHVCRKRIHRDDIGCGHDLGDDITIGHEYMRCDGLSTGVPFVSAPGEAD
jgi:hypothetical protein